MKNKFYSILFLIGYLPFISQGQEVGTFLDERDGNIYSTVKIDSTIWFQENLRLVTENSHCPNFNRWKRHCKHGNFYSYHELEKLCPQGWRVATVKDWEAYHKFIQLKKGISDTSFLIDTLIEGKFISIIIDDATRKMQHFDEFNYLNLKPIGWIQGKKRQRIKSITLWAAHQEIIDPRYHIHITANGYVKHTHKHNIDDTPKKNRKFAVRCVCDSKKK